MPQLPLQIWILAWGRLLSEIGTGFTLFYAPIFFVQQVGLSATVVGMALGSASISGVFGRIISGAGADRWGRKPMLILSTLASAIACGILALTNNLETLVWGCLFQGLGLGLYWPANEAIVADLTEGEQRRSAYAFTRLADNVGLGVGILAGGLLIARGGAYRSLFIIDGISFIIFGTILALGVSETLVKSSVAPKSFVGGYLAAGQDRRLQVYVLVNILFTMYISQTQSIVPLYFSNFINVGNGQGFAPDAISLLFAWHLLVTIGLQLPILKLLSRFSHARALICSSLLWSTGFMSLTITGMFPSLSLMAAITSLGILAVAIAAYIPTASALVADFAPPSLRGVYTSINSLCWAVGYAIGPTMGGWALDQSPLLAQLYWLLLGGFVFMAIPILIWLDRVVSNK